MAEQRYDDPIERALWGAKEKAELQDEYQNRFRFDLEGKEEENRRRIEEWEDNLRAAFDNPNPPPEQIIQPVRFLPDENPPNIGHLPGQIIEPPRGPMDYPNNLPPPRQNPFEKPSLPHMPPFAPLPDKPRGPR